MEKEEVGETSTGAHCEEGKIIVGHTHTHTYPKCCRMSKTTIQSLHTAIQYVMYVMGHASLIVTSI